MFKTVKHFGIKLPLSLARGETSSKWPRSRSFVALNISESRSWNFIRELERRGFARVDFTVNDWKTTIRDLFSFSWAVRRSAFVFCGPGLPWQLPWMFCIKLLGRKCVVDCPMDITVWPFPEKAHCRWLVRVALRSADCVLTIRSRAYFTSKFGLSTERVAYVESVPDGDLVLASLRVRPLFKLSPKAFTICLSGGSPPHRLERFLAIFDALVPLVPNVELLVIADRGRSLISFTTEYASQCGFSQRIRILPVIKPPEQFFAIVAQCQLWVATMGDDTLQGQCEFRMELLEVGLLGRPVLAVRTPGLEQHNLRDGFDIIYVDPTDPRGAAARIASFASRPADLAQLGLNLRQRIAKNYTLKAAGDAILECVGLTET